MSVLQFPNRRVHRYFKCDGIRCRDTHCVYCEGGLAFCVVCKQGEGELEQYCPGSPPAIDPAPGL